MAFIYPPSWVLVLLISLNLGILLVWMVQSRTILPLSLFIPLCYLAVVYIVADHVDIRLARSLSRWGVAVLMVALFAILYVHCRLRRGGKNAT